MNKKVILECKNIKKEYNKKDHKHIACKDINIKLHQNECLGIVGESGCGKSTLSKLIMKLENATEGEILFKDKDILKLKSREIPKYYKDVQMVFQDAIGSFDPKMTIGKSILEFTYNNEKYKRLSRAEKENKIMNLLEDVGLKNDIFYRFPNELSGGQCQRAAIARALAVDPTIIIFDEATSALDVYVQEKIIELLKELKCKKDLSYIFICHDLSLVSNFCDNIAIMYKGSLIEYGSAEEVLNNPKEEYSKLLIEHSLY